MSTGTSRSPVNELDTIVGMPAIAPCAAPSEPPPPKNSECRALFVPRPAPRLKAVPAGAPPPLPLAAKTAEPIAANDTHTMEIDASCIEEVRAIAAAEPARASTARQAPKHVRALDLARTASRTVLVSLRTLGFFAVYAAAAAIAWLRARFFPSMRALMEAAKARMAVEWTRASAAARQ